MEEDNEAQSCVHGAGPTVELETRQTTRKTYT